MSFLLLTRLVQDQVKSLTSGTSASHNRIKTKELAKVKIPLPISGTSAEKNLYKIVKDYKNSVKSMINETIRLSQLRNKEDEWRSAAA